MSDKDLKVKISVEGDTSGAKAVEASLKDVKAAAQDTEDELSQLLREQAEWSAKMRGQLDGVDGGAKPPPLPGGGPSTGDIAAGAGIGALGATAAIEAMGLLVKAGAALAQALGNGAAEAVNLAQELNSLPADKALALRNELGPLADIIATNSGTLLELGEASKQANQQLENFWTMAGVRLAPALRDMAQAAAGVDLSGIANGIGDTFGGAMVLVNRTGEAFGKVNAAVQEFVPGVDLGTAALQATNSALSGVIPGYGALALAVSGLTAVNQEAVAAEQAKQDALKESLASTAGVRAVEDAWAVSVVQGNVAAKARKEALESLLPTEERLALVKERLAKLANSGKTDPATLAEIDANNRLLVNLDAKNTKEKEALADKEEAKQKQLETYERQVAINEALAAGNKLEAERIRYAQDYADAMESTNGDAGLAKRSADAAAALRQQAEIKKQNAEDEKTAKKAEAEQIKNLQSQLALQKEQSETRLAEAKAAGESEYNLAKLKTAEAEKQRAIELEIAKIRGEEGATAAIQAEQRKQDALAIQGILKDAKDKIRDTAGGDTFDGTNRRRGSITSNAFESDIDAGKSLLDPYITNQDRAVGERGKKSPLGADPKSSVAKPIEDAATNMDEVKKAIAEVGSLLNDAVAATKEVSGEAKGAASALSNTLSGLRADIAAIKRASSGS